MIDLSKEIEPENLTQKDIMTFLLHSTQHTATREELQEVRSELKSEIQEVRSELKSEIQEVRGEIKSVRGELKAEIKELSTKIDKVDGKFDKLQWLIVATILAIFLKDYIFSILGT